MSNTLQDLSAPFALTKLFEHSPPKYRRTINANFSTRERFLNDYKFFLSAIVIPKEGNTQYVPGERVFFRCRFGQEAKLFEWPGLVISGEARTATNAPGYAIQFDKDRRSEIEQIIWSFARGTPARCEPRLEPESSLELLAEHPGCRDTRSVSAIDISLGGCQLWNVGTAVSAFVPRDRVRLRWANGTRVGKVRWARQGRFGVLFDVPLTDLASMAPMRTAENDNSHGERS